ncbi:MutS-related protein [Actinokineospora iranica]|uniref:MutS domain V n=1 Tax=Actinokineospora iranica TaxID=1271860 RepID=A0A1G6S3P1_9PSEU|nr:hypothetical protein [Actinokineospora iranica]SDD11311.1 MutS domain V [Actinokineospora iranica]
MIRSVLFGSSGPPAGLDDVPEPEHFRDLNLDQVAAALARDNADLPLTPYFRLPLRDAGLVRARQQVFRDLEDTEVLAVVERFTAAMRRMRRRLEMLAQVRHAPQRQRWFLDIVLTHVDTLDAFAAESHQVALASPALRGMRDDLGAHTASGPFGALRRAARDLRDRLDAVRYDMLLRDGRVTVAPRDPADDDFTARVLATFARFGARARRDYRKDLSADLGLDEIEAGVLDLVARLCPEVFGDLAAFAVDHADFVPADIARLDRELRFCLAYLSCLAPLRAAGLPTCYPEVSDTDKDLVAHDVFDLALAVDLVARGEPVVCNDVRLTGAERVLVVSGPNQGGKTTLSRAFGQLHHLAALGAPVPGSQVRVFLPDRVLTHYERAESLDTLSGKLEDELRRLRALIDLATPDSVLVLNEIFASTTSRDAQALSKAVLDTLVGLDVRCLWVSFVDELAQLNPAAVSMVSLLAGEGDLARGYRVVRAPADGRAYAHAVAERHGLTYAQLKARITR